MKTSAELSHSFGQVSEALSHRSWSYPANVRSVVILGIWQWLMIHDQNKYKYFPRAEVTPTPRVNGIPLSMEYTKFTASKGHTVTVIRFCTSCLVLLIWLQQFVAIQASVALSPFTSERRCSLKTWKTFCRLCAHMGFYKHMSHFEYGLKKSKLAFGHSKHQ